MENAGSSRETSGEGESGEGTSRGNVSAASGSSRECISRVSTEITSCSAASKDLAENTSNAAEELSRGFDTEQDIMPASQNTSTIDAGFSKTMVNSTLSQGLIPCPNYAHGHK